MSQTVIGIFEKTSEAQEARNYLLANGFAGENVDFSTNGSGSTTNNLTKSDETSVGSRVNNFFSNLFEDEDDVNMHTNAASRGTVVTVHAKTEEETLQAVKILDNFGAVDVNEFSGRMQMDGGAEKIQVIKEELNVGKQEVETGGVRLRSRIVSRPVEETIRLREEHVSVERNSVDRPATEADFANFKEGTIEEVEHAERAVVSKDAKVVEEVSLGKQVNERDETISETVRHTEVDTEDINHAKNNDRENNNF